MSHGAIDWTNREQVLAAVNNDGQTLEFAVGFQGD